MSETLWKNVDQYLAEKLLAEDSALAQVVERNTSAGLPAIDVSPLQGKFLHLLAKIQGARRILELGTLGGYSTIWLARALPSDGKVITLELEEKHARVARENLANAGIFERVEIRVGPALDSLTRLQAEHQAPFDFVFIDADKVNTAAYFEGAVKLCRPGSVIVADNVVRKGQICDGASQDANVLGMRRFMEAVAKHPRVDATTIQTVGAKGYDGFTLIRIES
jgi:predicted O-methyltransferase YrrM